MAVKASKDETKEKLASLTAKVDMLEQHKSEKSELVALSSALASNSRQTARLTNYLWFAFGNVYPGLHR